MTDPMTPEEIQACRERAEAATGLSPSDVRGGAFTWDGDDDLLADVVTTADALAALRADVHRLLATIDAAQRETAATRHAALFAAGVHGGPGAWRWASDPTGTTLDDTAAWERLLGEMRARTGRPEPTERKPVAGWEPGRPEGDWWRLAVGANMKALAYDADDPRDRHFSIVAVDADGLEYDACSSSGYQSKDAMLIAAEDALRAIADRIYAALRGGV